MAVVDRFRIEIVLGAMFLSLAHFPLTNDAHLHVVVTVA